MHILTWSFIIQQSIVGNSWESTFRVLEMAAVSPDYWVLSFSTRTTTQKAICDDRNLLIMGSRMTGCQEQSGTKLEGGWNRAASVKEIVVINFVWLLSSITKWVKNIACYVSDNLCMLWSYMTETIQFLQPLPQRDCVWNTGKQWRTVF